MNLVGMFLLLTRYRTNVIFAKRGPLLVTIEVLSLMVAFTVFVARSITQDDKLDADGVYVYYLFGLSALCAVFFRLVSLYFALTRTEYFFQRRMSVIDTCWKRNKRFLTPRNLAIGMGVFLLIVLLVLTWILKQDPDVLLADGSIQPGKWLRKIYIALFAWVVVGLASVYVAWKLRGTGEENFGIKTELKVKVLCAGILMLAIFLGLNKKVKNASVQFVDIRMIVSWPAAILETVFAVWKVIWDIRADQALGSATEVEVVSHRATATSEIGVQAGQTTENDIAKNGERDIMKVDLNEILADSNYLERFTEFLCRELSVEHLYFIQQVQAWKNKWAQVENLENWQDYVTETVRVYEEFVNANGVAPVNISFSVRKAVKDTVSNLQQTEERKIQVDTFDGAYDEVYKLLKLDSLTRFRREMKLKPHRTASVSPVRSTFLSTRITGI
jgi:hypothetical protein